MKKCSAMIVDDSETDRYLLKRFLGRTDIIENVFEKVDGLDAITFLKNYKENKEKDPNNFPPTFIFLDINMPKMNGFEFLKHFEDLKKQYNDMSIVIMMVTSSGNKDDIEKAFKFDCVKDYLEKGRFKVDDLKSKISKHI